MLIRFVKNLPEFSDHLCCDKPAVGIWRETPRQKWQYLCEDCIADKLGLTPEDIKEVFCVPF